MRASFNLYILEKKKFRCKYEFFIKGIGGGMKFHFEIYH